MQHQGPLHHRPQRRRLRNALLLPLIPNGIESRGLEGQLVSHLKLLPRGQGDRKSEVQSLKSKAGVTDYGTTDYGPQDHFTEKQKLGKQKAEITKSRAARTKGKVGINKSPDQKLKATKQR
jgi:hypothetical protein